MSRPPAAPARPRSASQEPLPRAADRPQQAAFPTSLTSLDQGLDSRRDLEDRWRHVVVLDRGDRDDLFEPADLALHDRRLQEIAELAVLARDLGPGDPAHLRLAGRDASRLEAGGHVVELDVLAAGLSNQLEFVALAAFEQGLLDRKSVV